MNNCGGPNDGHYAGVRWAAGWVRAFADSGSSQQRVVKDLAFRFPPAGKPFCRPEGFVAFAQTSDCILRMMPGSAGSQAHPQQPAGA